GNLAADARIDAEIHHTHGAAAELALDLVAPDARPAAAVVGQRHGVDGPAAAAAQGLAFQRLHALDAGVDVRVQRRNRLQVPVDAQRLGVMPLAFVVEAEIVELAFHQLA